MTITIKLTSEMEARLFAGIAQRDPNTVRQVLIEAVEPTVEALITEGRTPVTVEEFKTLLDEMEEVAAAALPPDWQGLSEYALSREGIYEDHP